MAEFPKFDLKYLKEAFKEPINFWGMAGFAVATAYVQDITPLVAALAAETLYLATVPASSVYRRLVDKREKQRLLKLREQQREALIKQFDPREREAVESISAGSRIRFTPTTRSSPAPRRFLITLRVLIRDGKILLIYWMSIADENTICVQSTAKPFKINSYRQSDR